MMYCSCDVIDDAKVIDFLKENGPATTQKQMRVARARMHEKHRQPSYPGGQRCAKCPQNLGEAILKHSHALTPCQGESHV